MATRNDVPNNSVIGENSVFEGRFYVSGSILIEGKFDGQIKTEDHLTVGPTGKVKTDIYARKVTISGTLIGNITASEEVDLLENGKVLGNIVSPKINVENGVLIQGMVTLTGDQADDVSKVIRQSFGEEAESVIAASEHVVKKEKPKEPKPE
jgi:cytoskeletal protein CcmA (bactofilin family)